MLRAMLRFVLIATVLPGLNAQCETAAANVEFTLSKNEHLKVEWQDGTGEGWDNARSTSPSLPFIIGDRNQIIDNPPFPSGKVRIFNAGTVQSPYHPQNGQRFDIIVTTPVEATQYVSQNGVNSAPFIRPIAYNYPRNGDRPNGVATGTVENFGHPLLITDLGYLCLGYGLEVRPHSRTRTAVCHGHTTHFHVSEEAADMDALPHSQPSYCRTCPDGTSYTNITNAETAPATCTPDTANATCLVENVNYVTYGGDAPLHGLLSWSNACGV